MKKGGKKNDNRRMDHIDHLRDADGDLFYKQKGVIPLFYLEYDAAKIKYREMLMQYEEILSEKAELFAKTQPQSVQYDKDRVSGGEAVNKFDEYIVKKDRKKIDERLAEIRSLLEDRERLLRLKEKELRLSSDIRDKVYLMRHVDNMRIYKIANITHYSEAQIYRILHDIRETVKHDRK